MNFFEGVFQGYLLLHGFFTQCNLLLETKFSTKFNEAKLC